MAGCRKNGTMVFEGKSPTVVIQKPCVGIHRDERYSRLARHGGQVLHGAVEDGILRLTVFTAADVKAVQDQAVLDPSGMIRRKIHPFVPQRGQGIDPAGQEGCRPGRHRGPAVGIPPGGLDGNGPAGRWSRKTGRVPAGRPLPRRFRRIPAAGRPRTLFSGFQFSWLMRPFRLDLTIRILPEASRGIRPGLAGIERMVADKRGGIVVQVGAHEAGDSVHLRKFGIYAVFKNMVPAPLFAAVRNDSQFGRGIPVDHPGPERFGDLVAHEIMGHLRRPAGFCPSGATRGGVWSEYSPDRPVYRRPCPGKT